METSNLNGTEVRPPRLFASLALPPEKALVALIIGTMAAVSSVVLAADDRQLAGAALAFVLAWAAVIDADRFKLPDAITLPMIGFGLLFAAMGHGDFLDHAAGAAIGYAALASLSVLYRAVRKRHGLGLGDAKLFAGAGAWLGLTALPFVMLVSAASALAWILVAAIFRRRALGDGAIAFGPFLALGVWLCWLGVPVAAAA